MKNLKILSLLIVSILISGCTQKEPEIIYKKAPIYKFQTVDFKNAYIEAKEASINETKLSKAEVLKVCNPLLQELNTIYKETKSFYDEQINDYIRLNKESK